MEKQPKKKKGKLFYVLLSISIIYFIYLAILNKYEPVAVIGQSISLFFVLIVIVYPIYFLIRWIIKKARGLNETATKP